METGTATSQSRFTLKACVRFVGTGITQVHSGMGTAFTGLRQGLWQVLGGLHNVQHALLVHAQLGRLRQRVRDGQLDGVVACMGWVISPGDISSLKDLSLQH